MEVYVEPYLPRPELIIVGHGRIAEILAQMAHTVHFSVTVNDSSAKREEFPMADHLITSDLDFSQLIVGPKTYVVVVTQHKGDQHSIKKALEGNGPYIGLVASTKRAKLVFDYLLEHVMFAHAELQDSSQHPENRERRCSKHGGGAP